MNIGLLGLTFGYKRCCNNRGCEALSISFLEILNEIAKRNNSIFNVYIFVPISIKKALDLTKGKDYLRNVYIINKTYSNLRLDIICYWIFKGIPFLGFKSKKCNVIIDFTSGDSFTDIYGSERYYKLTKAKKQILKMKIPLVLGSQTIGPFNDPLLEADAANVINRCKEVFVRDHLSYDYVKKISGRRAKMTTDVAFFLPFKRMKRDYNKILIGFNPSGLLWQGGYNRNNQFGLKFNYRDYCIKLIEELLKDSRYEIILIPHAYSSDMSSIDNDLIPVMELKRMFPACISIIDSFNSMEVKSKINQCDIFIGARMHATIAAFSSGIPTIPVAYSRKFIGLYNEFDYSYIIDANKNTIDEAVEKTISFVNDIDIIRTEIERCKPIIAERKESIIELYTQLLKSISSTDNKVFD